MAKKDSKKDKLISTNKIRLYKEEIARRYQSEEQFINKRCSYPQIELLNKHRFEFIVSKLFSSKMPLFQVLLTLGYSSDMTDSFFDYISSPKIDRIQRKAILSRIKENEAFYEKNEKAPSRVLLEKIILLKTVQDDPHFPKIYYYSLTSLPLQNLYFNYINGLKQAFNQEEQTVIESFFYEPLKFKTKKHQNKEHSS